MTSKAKISSKKKFFDYRLLFSFKGRINRLKLIEGLFTVWVFILITGIILAVISPKIWSSPSQDELIGSVYKLLAMLFAIFTISSLIVKRSHDLDCSGWSVFLSIVPIANAIYFLFLLFKLGTLGENRFGHDLLGRKNFVSKIEKINSDFTICSSCGAKCDDSAFDCPNCGEKFWQSRKDYEKFLKSKKTTSQ